MEGPASPVLRYKCNACELLLNAYSFLLLRVHRPRVRKKRESLAARSQISAGTSGEQVHFDDPQSMGGDLSTNESQSSPVHHHQIYQPNSQHVGNVLSNMPTSEAPSGTDWAMNFQESRPSAQQTPGSGAGALSQHHTSGNRNGVETADPTINDNLASKERDASQALTYIGRSHYIAGDSPIDEASARSYTSSRIEGLSSTEVQILELSGSFSLPSKSARQSLIETFMQYCYPWMPTLTLSELDQDAVQPCSLLLMQSVFLAASRVSSSPVLLGHASSEQFYQRAKALFWAGHEKDPLTAIKAITMLHWYNPDGPAFVSCDTSEFWLKIGVGLAYQIGLHKEPPPGSDRGIRRRIWWSLVVSSTLLRLNLMLTSHRYAMPSSPYHVEGPVQSIWRTLRSAHHVWVISRMPKLMESYSSHTLRYVAYWAISWSV